MSYEIPAGTPKERLIEMKQEFELGYELFPQDREDINKVLARIAFELKQQGEV